MSWEQREELHSILHWVNSPVTSPIDFMVKLCVKNYLNGVDAEAELLKMGAELFVARRMTDKARSWLNNERGKRRNQAKQILEHRSRKNPGFTSENFHVTMDTSQDRNFGMVSTSIYCIVEVWVDDDQVEKEYLVNFSDFKTKEWLTRLLVWGLMNKREILIKPATEHEMGTMRMFVPSPKENVG